MGQKQSQAPESGSLAGTHEPTIADIMTVKDLFCQVSSPLPIELVDEILDLAEYWAHGSVSLLWRDIIPGSRRDDGEYGKIKSDKMYMRLPPLGMYGTDNDLIVDRDHDHTAALGDLYKSDELRGLFGKGKSQKKIWASPRGEHPCRKIMFDIWSHDQGVFFIS